MFEETNQTQESVFDDFSEGFDDTCENEVLDAQEEINEEQQENTAEQEQPEQQEKTYSLKYNGRQVDVPEAELITLAQKGMNYDHVYGELQSLRNNDELKIIDQYARQSGLSRSDYIRFLEREMENQQIAKTMQQGVSEQAARRMMELERRELQRQEIAAREEKEQAKRAQYDALAKEYPNLRELPPQVVQAIRGGEAPLAAYRAYENRLLKQELEAAKTNARNREKAMGSMQDSAAGHANDDFLSGWDSE